MKYPLRYYGDPILRVKAEPIKEITDEIRTLAQDMIETMLACDGIGLAANQIGIALRIYVSNVDYEDKEGKIHLGEPKVYINPIFSQPSDILVERNEACLSIPKLYGPVLRPLTINLEAMDIEGKTFKKECYGFFARNMLHENDHLNGVLYVDRVKGKKRKELEPFLREIKEKYN